MARSQTTMPSFEMAVVDRQSETEPLQAIAFLRINLNGWKPFSSLFRSSETFKPMWEEERYVFGQQS